MELDGNGCCGFRIHLRYDVQLFPLHLFQLAYGIRAVCWASGILTSLVVHFIINGVSYLFNAAGKHCSSGYQSFLNLIVLNCPITDMIALCLLVSPVFVIKMGHLERALAISAMLL